MSNEKELIHFDKVTFDKEKKQLEENQERLQNLLDMANGIGEFEVKKATELKLIAEKGSEGLKQILADRMEPPKVLGLPLKRKETVELMELPKDQLNEIDSLSREINHLNVEKFEVRKGKVEIPDSLIKDLERKNSLYAESSEEIELLEAINEAKPVLERFHKVASKTGKPLFFEPSIHEGRKTRLHDFFIYGKEKLEINPEVFRELKRGKR